MKDRKFAKIEVEIDDDGILKSCHARHCDDTGRIHRVMIPTTGFELSSGPQHPGRVKIELHRGQVDLRIAERGDSPDDPEREQKEFTRP